jgi:hypothetical protein
MSKLKIEKGASRIRRVALKTTIDGTVADDIELLCKWSENDTSYVVNHLLRFALSQSEDFQAHKQSLEAGPSPVASRPQVESPTLLARSAEAGR